MKKLLFCFSLFITIFNLPDYAQVSVIMQHNDLKRTGWNNQEKVLTQNNVQTATFGKLFSRTVDEQIYAQPLVVANLKIAGARHNVVFLATVNNSVYAYDAEISTASTPFWKINLTPTGYRAIKNSDMSGACGGNYKDFSGKMGIVSTPALDTISKTLYVVVRSVDSTSSPKKFVQYLHAINILTGAERPNSPVYITASVSGNGAGNISGNITFDQQRQNQRSALLLFNNIVYISWASHCDWGPYHGWVMGYDATTLQQKIVYNDTPDGDNGGIWMSGQGPAVDDSGYIYLSTGNGTVGSNGNANVITNRGESILKMTPQAGTLKVVDFFTPADYTKLEQLDLDYGCDGVLLLPQTHLSLSGSKESLLYLTDNNNLGKMQANNGGAKQVIDINAKGSGDHHLHGTPVYYVNKNRKEYIYAWAEGGLLKQLPFKRSAGVFDTAHIITGTTILPNGMPGAMLAISSSGTNNSTGILWASHPLSGDANHAVVPGILQAFDANDVTRELWNSDMNPGRDSVGKFAKFVCPTIANGKVYLATFSGRLDVYGLLDTKAVTEEHEQASAINKRNLIVYPNPAQQEVNVQYNNLDKENSKATIQLLDQNGSLVVSKDILLHFGENVVVLTLSASVHNGEYLVKMIFADGATNIIKLLIQR